MRFGLLGPLAVWTADGKPVRIPEAKVRALLAILLIHRGGPVSADRLADDLWGERRPGNPANTLQTKISQLRQALEAAEPGGRDLVTHQPGGYRLRSPVEVDEDAFRTLLTRARDTVDLRSRVAFLADALALWRGPALADLTDDPFAAPVIHRLEEERLTAREDLAEARLARGEHGALTGELDDLVTRYPLRERLRGLQLRALYRSGRQSEALESYRELRTRLAGELGLEPGPELAALHQSILEQTPPPAEAAASSTRRWTNLPAPVTELVGRTAAVRAIRTHVGESRLVTLTGPGGVGKTRLAVEVAHELAESFSGGVWLVEFAGLDQHGDAPASGSTDEHLAEAVSAALGIRQDASGDGAADLLATLTDALRGAGILLVLDNCERLVSAVSRLAARLLAASASLRILATGQEPLGIPGELIWTVPPLDVPGRPALDTDRSGADVLSGIREFSAVRLFAARASAAAPGFTLEPETAPVIAAICRALDGIPLALELAATRVRALGARELLDRLDDRFRLLNSGHRGAPARQRTLRAMIDWSWELLTEPERAVLRRLAVHVEGCGLDAAEAICPGDDVPPGAVPDLLARLVDRSLVVPPERTGTAPRYRLLESVAAYGTERMIETGEAEAVRARHGHYYLGLAERADPRLRGGDQQRWLRCLDAESGNLRYALETFVRHGHTDLALRMAIALTWYRFLRGRLREARRSLRAGLALPGGSLSLRATAGTWETGLAALAGEEVDLSGHEHTTDLTGIADPVSRARARWFLGHVMSTLGDIDLAEELTDEALTAFRALGDPWGIAAASSDRVAHAVHRGDLTRARGEAETGAELFEELGDRWGRLQAVFALGMLAQLGGDYETSARLHRDGLRIAEELQLWPEVAYQLSWLGRSALLTGEHEQARLLHERARRVAVEQGFKPGEMYAETGLALGARRAGDLDRAHRHLLSVLDWHRGDGSESGSTLILAELGFVAEQRGDVRTARTWHREGLALACRVRSPRAIALALEGLAGVHTLADEPGRAARLLGAAAQARESAGAALLDAERLDVDRARARATAILGERAFEEEFTRGARHDLADLASAEREAREPVR